MPKTAVGLFENPGLLEKVIVEIAALGFPRTEVRALQELRSFEVAGAMSFPRLDYEVELRRELRRIGATAAEVDAYVKGLQRGGALVFATGPDQKVAAAAEVMNRRGAVEIEQDSGAEPNRPETPGPRAAPNRDSPVLAGRIREPAGGAALFVW